MGLLTGFNANEIEAPSYEPPPPGWYTACAIESERKAAKSGNGDYLQFVLRIAEGDFKGRKAWARFNLWTKKEQAQEIAQAQFAGFCQAADVMTPDEPEDLHYRYVEIKVTHREYNGNTQLEIKGFRPVDSGAAPTPKPTAVQSTKTEPARKQQSKGPWARQ